MLELTHWPLEDLAKNFRYVIVKLTSVIFG